MGRGSEKERKRERERERERERVREIDSYQLQPSSDGWHLRAVLLAETSFPVQDVVPH
jgi:hypothetical protein